MSLSAGSSSASTHPPEVVHFGGLGLERSDEVLEPRAWTVAQSRWAAQLVDGLEEGPVLELYSGAGQIGLELTRLTGRPLVQVDASAEACRLARRNADRNGLGDLVHICHSSIAVPLGGHRSFALVLADPPYVPTDEVARYPSDPRSAIDGGPDGMDHIIELIRVVPNYLRPTTPVLVQVRGAAQADQLRDAVEHIGSPLRIAEVRSHGDDRALVLLHPA